MESRYGVLIARIAAQHDALQYDANDREREEIEKVALSHGLHLMPSEHVTPRTIRGATRPEPQPEPLPDEDTLDGDRLAQLQAVADALNDSLARAGTTAEGLLRHLAHDMVVSLQSAGWRLVPADDRRDP